MRDPSTKKPLVWNNAKNQALPFDDPATLDMALEGEYTVNGVVAHPAYQLIKDSFKQYTPEWQEPITTVPAATVRRIANEFVDHAHIGATIIVDGFEFPYRPVSFNNERGTADHKGGTYADVVTKIINMLVGAIEVPGSCLANCSRSAGPLTPDKDGTVTPTGEAAGVKWKFPPDQIDMSTFYPNKHTGPHLTVKAINDPQKYYINYKVGVWLGAGGNSISSCGGQDTFISAYKKVGHVAHIAYHFDAPAMLSDILLPEHSYMERLYASQPGRPHQNISDEVNGLKMVFVREPVPTLYNTKHCDEIYIELAERGGYLYGAGGLIDKLNSGQNFKGDLALDLNKKPTVTDVYDRIVKVFDPKLSLQAVMPNGHAKYWVAKYFGYNYYYWPDNKTRHPFYFMHLKEVADQLKANLQKDNAKIPGWDDQADFFDYWKPIPHYKPNTENAPNVPGYDLFAINWKMPFYANGVGAPHENAWLEDIIAHGGDYHSKIWMNPATAAAKGIKDGDIVIVESREGKTQGPVLLTEMIHPEVLGFPGMRGTGTILQNPVTQVGPHFNRLIRMADNTFDPVNGSLDVSPRVKVYKA